MTFKILTDDTQKIIHWSNVHSALDPNEPNLHVDPIQSSLSPIIKSRHDNSDGETPMPIINPADLIGKVFTMDSGESGESCQACIVEMIDSRRHHKSYKNLFRYQKIFYIQPECTEN